MKILFSSSFFFLSFFLFADQLNSKTIVCMRILHIPNDMLWSIFLVGVREAYELHVQLVSYGPETVSINASLAHSLTSGASVYVFPACHVSQATPGLLNVCATVRKQKFEYSFLLLGLEHQISATEDTVVHLRTCSFGSPECDIARFRGKYIAETITII